MLDESLIWFILFLFLAIVSILVIPRKELSKLLPIGIFAGFLLAMLLLVFLVPLLGLWQFKTAVYPALGFPIFSAALWIPAVMIFSYYTPLFDKRNMLIYWILIFTTLTTIVIGLITNAGFISFINWDLMATFLLSFAIHSILALFILKYNIVQE